MASGHQTFTYQPLDHETRDFRLLRLLPSPDFESEIHCELFHSSLDNHPPYESLSYVWGDASDTTLIRLHDINHEITRNLALALRYLRLQEETRIIWADALCIDQKDSIEKTHQVRQMRSIYLNAEQVVVWMGEDTHGNAKEIMDLFERGSQLADFFGVLIAGQRREEAQIFWNLSDALFDRSWWTRTWTLQEVTHHRPVKAYIGHYQLDFDDLCDKYYWYSAYGFALRHVLDDEEQVKPLTASGLHAGYEGMFLSTSRVTDVLEYVQQTRQKWKKAPTGVVSALEAALLFCRNQQCSDPRDKVFAFLEMAGSYGPASATMADYSLTKREIYTSAMQNMLDQTLEPTSLMTAVQSLGRPIVEGELPSWVVDWTTRQDIFSRLCYMSSHQFLPQFEGESSLRPDNHKVSVVFRGGTMILTGIYIGFITQVAFIDITKRAFRGLLPEEMKMKIFKYTKNDNRQLHSLLGPPQVDESPQLSMTNSSWGAPLTEPGDIIIVSKICPVPLILRKNGDSYLFVGACWLVDSELQGIVDPRGITKDTGFSSIMRGSAWDESKIEIFVID